MTDINRLAYPPPGRPVRSVLTSTATRPISTTRQQLGACTAMALGPDYRTVSRTSTTAVEIDAGLRQYMLRVYNYMAGGVALTGIVAYVFANMLASNQQLLYAVYGSPLKWVIIFAPLAFALLFGMRIRTMATATAQLLFWAFAAVIGLS